MRRQTIVWAATVVRFVAAVAIVPCAVIGAWQAVLAITFVAFGSDFVDGLLARRWKLVSEAGAFWDPVADKVICLVLLGLIAALKLPWYWVLFLIFLTYDTSTTVLRLLLARSMPASRVAKYKTALQMLGLLAVLGGFGVGSVILEVCGSVCLVVAAGIALISFAHYLRALAAGAHWLEQALGVTELNFADWHDRCGITTVLFDIEGTLTPWRSSQVRPAVVAKLVLAKKQGITRFGIVSNMTARHASRAAAVAGQIGAQTYHVPLARQHRKPSSYMVEQALKQLGSSPDESGFVGDKIVDILAAHRAGLARVAWVRRLGAADHLFDKLVYRPFESLVRWIISR